MNAEINAEITPRYRPDPTSRQPRGKRIGCISAASRLHLGRISAASRLHLGLISAVTSLPMYTASRYTMPQRETVAGEATARSFTCHIRKVIAAG